MPAKRSPRQPKRNPASPLRRPRSLAFRKLRRGLPLTVSQQRSQQAKDTTSHASAAALPAPALPAPPAPLPAAALPAPALPVAALPASLPSPALRALPPIPPADISAPAPSPAVAAPNALVLRGDYWQISYGGSTSLVQDCRGLRYIAILIRDASGDRGPIHARELVAFATGQEAGPIELERPVDLLDARARTQLLDRLAEVASDRELAVATGDLDRAAALDDEHERIGDELARAAGPRGARQRGGAFTDAGEKARKAVGKAITEAVQRIAQAPGLAPLARHLGSSVHKGLWLSYAGAASWHIELPAPLPRK